MEKYKPYNCVVIKSILKNESYCTGIKRTETDDPIVFKAFTRIEENENPQHAMRRAATEFIEQGNGNRLIIGVECVRK